MVLVCSTAQAVAKREVEAQQVTDDIELRKLAIEMVTRLPTDRVEALRVREYMRALIKWWCDRSDSPEHLLNPR
jgi:hypothetical protein